MRSDTVSEGQCHSDEIVAVADGENDADAGRLCDEPQPRIDWIDASDVVPSVTQSLLAGEWLGYPTGEAAALRISEPFAVEAKTGTGSTGVNLVASVLDDNSADQIDILQGSSGNDWFIYENGEDRVVGQSEASN